MGKSTNSPQLNLSESPQLEFPFNSSPVERQDTPSTRISKPTRTSLPGLQAMQMGSEIDK